MAPDGTGFSSDNADKYYAKIRNNERKHYAKSHIAIDVDSRLILYSQAVRGAKHDTTFVIASIRSLKKHDPEYVIADKAYDTEKIRECINKEIKASDQIPLKSNFRHGWYRRLSQKTFNKEIYSLRNNVESVFSVIKRKLNENNKSKSTRLQNNNLQYSSINQNRKIGFRQSQNFISFLFSKTNSIKLDSIFKGTPFLVFKHNLIFLLSKLIYKKL